MASDTISRFWGLPDLCLGLTVDDQLTRQAQLATRVSRQNQRARTELLPLFGGAVFCCTAAQFGPDLLDWVKQLLVVMTRQVGFLDQQCLSARGIGCSRLIGCDPRRGQTDY